MLDSSTEPKILLVDDDPFILNATAAVLRAAGFSVHTCEQWAGVATLVRQEEPDLVLMDYNMPSLRGDDLCAILKRNVINANMKIVIYSSEAEADLVRITSQCGADGYLRKDVASHSLVARVRALLQPAVA